MVLFYESHLNNRVSGNSQVKLNSQRVVWSVPHDTLAIFVCVRFGKLFREKIRVYEDAVVPAVAVVRYQGYCLCWNKRFGVPCDNL